jgi:hypothetical protein
MTWIVARKRSDALRGNDPRDVGATQSSGGKETLGELTMDAVDLGLGAALPPVIDLESQIAEVGRGERRQTSTTDLHVPVRLPFEIALTGVRR